MLVTGGLVPAGVGPATIDDKTAEIFDPSSGTFSPTGDMTVPRFNHTAIALNDGRVLIVGGNGRNTAEVYDPTSGTFSAVGDMEVAHGLGHCAVKLLDGRVLVVGGDAGSIQPSAVVEIFDPTSSVRTVTATIAAELGEVAQGDPHWRVLFLLGVLLFTTTFVLNRIGSAAVERLHRKLTASSGRG